jgi:uncharacterized protein
MQDPAPFRLGLIADTHGFVDPKLAALFDGVDHILHAGDIGPAAVLRELERVAPVTAVLGNNDLLTTCDLTEVVELGGRKFLVHHIVDPRAPEASLRLRIAREQPDLVVFGHTHRAFDQVVDGVRFVNPGYAGQPRFNLARSVAIAELSPPGIAVTFHAL